MKIVKQGKLPEEQIYTGICCYCKTVMEAKRAELKFQSHRNETYYTANCLLCNKSVSFDVKKQITLTDFESEEGCYNR